jgi:uncharacterized membrane protein YgcG
MGYANAIANRAALNVDIQYRESLGNDLIHRMQNGSPLTQRGFCNYSPQELALAFQSNAFSDKRYTLADPVIAFHLANLVDPKVLQDAYSLMGYKIGAVDIDSFKLDARAKRIANDFTSGKGIFSFVNEEKKDLTELEGSALYFALLVRHCVRQAKKAGEDVSAYQTFFKASEKIKKTYLPSGTSEQDGQDGNSGNVPWLALSSLALLALYLTSCAPVPIAEGRYNTDVPPPVTQLASPTTVMIQPVPVNAVVAQVGENTTAYQAPIKSQAQQISPSPIPTLDDICQQIKLPPKLYTDKDGGIVLPVDANLNLAGCDLQLVYSPDKIIKGDYSAGGVYFSGINTLVNKNIRSARLVINGNTIGILEFGIPNSSNNSNNRDGSGTNTGEGAGGAGSGSGEGEGGGGGGGPPPPPETEGPVDG